LNNDAPAETRGEFYVKDGGTVFLLMSRQWYALLRQLVESGKKPLRDKLAHRLSETHHAMNPGQDETPIPVRLEDPVPFEAIEKAAKWASIELAQVNPPVEEQPVVTEQSIRRTRPKNSKTSRPCECGCGEFTGGGMWRPGHDSRKKSALIRAVDNDASEDAARELVERGWWKQEKADERLSVAREKKSA
jgi:hypothetical protein